MITFFFSHETAAAAILLGDGIDEMTCGVELTKSELVVVFVVENVEKGGKERMEVLVWSGGR